MKLLDEAELGDLWKILPEALKRKRIEKAYKVLRPTIKRQSKYFEELKKTPRDRKEAGHLYIFTTIQSFWDNAELAFKMGKKRHLRNFVFYPVRTTLETTLRFKYFCTKNQADRDIISAKELLRAAKRLYDYAVLTGTSTAPFVQSYTSIAKLFSVRVPPINKAHDRRDLDAFPDVRELCLQSGHKKPEQLYLLYKWLCEASHGKPIATVMRKQNTDFQEYRRAFSFFIILCQEMMLLVDKMFLNSKMREQIEPVVKKSNELLRGPATGYEKFVLKLRSVIRR